MNCIVCNKDTKGFGGRVIPPAGQSRPVCTRCWPEVERLLQNMANMQYLVDAGDVITDGFGGCWSSKCPECGEKAMQVVRPGKVQCGNCG
jgi:hypothetical protein